MGSKAIYLLLASLAFAGCGRRGERQADIPASNTPSDDGGFAKRRFLERASSVLRAGDGTDARDALAELMTLSQGEVVDRFMADPRFATTLLDFNLYYLGFKPAVTSSALAGSPGLRRFDDAAFTTPAAIVAAQETFAGGDFYKIYAPDAPLFISNFGRPNAVPGATGPRPSDHDLRAQWLAKAEAAHDAIAPAFAAPAATAAAPARKWDRNAACRALNNGVNGTDGIQQALQRAALPSTVVLAFLRNYESLLVDCAVARATIDRVQALAAVDAVKPRFALLATLLETPMARYVGYGDATLLAPVDPAAFGLAAPPSQLTQSGFWNALPGSSTNFDRKRSAYVLRTYFCDNLAPLDVGTSSHAGDGTQHAGDPACAACHYKLDPMAGFFRDYGRLGTSFAGRTGFIFDDNTVFNAAQHATYLKAWAAPTGAGRAWNVGYVREDAARSSYGESLTDLFGIVKAAPEARRCLAQRLTEYVLGSDQVFDPGYVQSLADKLPDPAQAAPGAAAAAVKDMIKELVTSNTFNAASRVPGQCYDFAPGAPPPEVPCAVNYIVSKTCTSCHSSTATPPHLDLTTWITLADGSQSFPHLDANAMQHTRAETMGLILDRLSTTDDARRMPLGQDMDVVQRASLYTWIAGEDH